MENEQQKDEAREAAREFGLPDDLCVMSLNAHTELSARLAEYEEMLGDALEFRIEGDTWSISNNGNPSRLIALRKHDGKGNLLSYTHHDAALDAWKALKQENR